MSKIKASEVFSSEEKKVILWIIDRIGGRITRIWDINPQINIMFPGCINITRWNCDSYGKQPLIQAG